MKEIKYNKEELNENLNSQREIVVCGLGYFQAQEDLKQEAIKRIKKIRKDFKKGTAGQTEDYNFMDLFNITEEDLK